MSYTQLTEGKRYQIHALLKNHLTQKEIADQLGVHKSTLSREISRNTGMRGYRPKQAHEAMLERRQSARKRSAINNELGKIITEYLELDWSPEQISGFLKSENQDWVSHETIYQFVLDDKVSGGKLYRHLRHSNKIYKKRYGSSDRRGQIKDRVSIDERPKHIEKRERIGDWEIDLVIGKGHKGAIVTIVDRLSLMTLIAKVSHKQSDLVTHSTVELLKKYKRDAAFTITADNGKEFSGHKDISKLLGVDFYFAHPYSSWERGTNENTNGLIRQYLPKGTEFGGVDEAKCEFIMSRLNTRPRKCLGYKTPQQVFEEYLEAA